jgi:hypothetical protein
MLLGKEGEKMHYIAIDFAKKYWLFKNSFRNSIYLDTTRTLYRKKNSTDIPRYNNNYRVGIFIEKKWK